MANTQRPAGRPVPDIVKAVLALAVLALVVAALTFWRERAERPPVRPAPPAGLAR